ncbi:RNase H domain-containing protein [Trichonephila clavipes]|nr:RNase H domain-containing protein [Trichonephila clavipes]
MFEIKPLIHKSSREVGGRERNERWEAFDHPQSVLPLNWGGTKPNNPVTCMVLKATANDRRHIAHCHNEFRGPRSGLCRTGIQRTNSEKTSEATLIVRTEAISEDFLDTTAVLLKLSIFATHSSSNNIIVEIQKQLKSLRDKNFSIDFAFVRGHTGVLGNERADWLAKAATKRKIDIDVNIPKSFYKKITKERMVKSWNQEYLVSNKGSITKKFFPTINRRLSCHHFYTNYKLTQILTGHGNFKSYLKKFNLAPSSFCDCNIGGEENVEHV